MSPTIDREFNIDLNAQNRIELDGKINYVFYTTEMETYLEDIQRKNFSCETLTVVNCLEDTFGLQLIKSTEEKKPEI